MTHFGCVSQPGTPSLHRTTQCVTMNIGQVRKLIKRVHDDGFETGMQLSKSLNNLGTQTMGDVIKDAVDKTNR